MGTSADPRPTSTRAGLWRSRWAAAGAAVAVSIGGGGLLTASASTPGSVDTLTTITPCRVLDTRTGVGGRATPLGPAETSTQQVTGSVGECAVPAGASAVAANITAVDGSASSYLTVWPAGATRPTASSLNWVAGQAPTPNAVTTKLSPTGQIDLYNFAGRVNIVIDIVGYYTAHDHDDRYLPLVTTLLYDGANTEPSPTGVFELMRTIGTVTKLRADTTLRLDWTAHALFSGVSGTNFCHYQLRIDGKATDGSSGPAVTVEQGANAVSYADAGVVSTVGLFPGLATGAHSVEVWVRGAATSCTLNNGNFAQQVVVTEFVAAPGSSVVFGALTSGAGGVTNGAPNA